jgi:hypothetical protein
MHRGLKEREEGVVVSREPIAHVAEDGRVHPLEEHLRGTAKLAAGATLRYPVDLLQESE